MDDVQPISWTVGGGEPLERSNDWYWGLGLFAIVGAGASVFFGNILLAVILLVGAFSIAVLTIRGPREHKVSVDPRGISVDGTRYPYTAVYSFWVEQEFNPPHLFLSMRGVLAPHFSFPIPDRAQAQEVRAFLQKFATEEEQGPRLGDRLAEIFGL
jgi:hypothetical protein